MKHKKLKTIFAQNINIAGVLILDKYTPYRKNGVKVPRILTNP